MSWDGLLSLFVDHVGHKVVPRVKVQRRPLLGEGFALLFHHLSGLVGTDQLVLGVTFEFGAVFCEL